MRKRAVVSASLASLGILAIGWQAGAHAPEAARPTAAGSAGTTGSTGATGATGAQAKAQATYAGTTVSTRYGSVQVQITVQNGKITEVTALRLTDAERRSQMISATAAPILRSEVLQAQSASVQTVSGATTTSEAYLASLQAALDAAHL